MMRNWNYENDQWTKLPGHLKHLPLFTRHFDLTSWFFRGLWGAFLKGFMFRFYVRIRLHGTFESIWDKYPRLIIISNHASHIDAVSITSAMPFRYWLDLYISAAKDYWFRNSLFTFFSQHCMGAIPIDRKDKKGEAIKLCTSLLTDLDRIWMIMFPEGTRSPDGYVKRFKRGVSLFSKKTNTPVLFLYIDGNAKIFPKGAAIPKPGAIDLHIGPVLDPSEVDLIDQKYREFALSINPNAYAPDENFDINDDHDEQLVDQSRDS